MYINYKLLEENLMKRVKEGKKGWQKSNFPFHRTEICQTCSRGWKWRVSILSFDVYLLCILSGACKRGWSSWSVLPLRIVLLSTRGGKWLSGIHWVAAMPEARVSLLRERLRQRGGGTCSRVSSEMVSMDATVYRTWRPSGQSLIHRDQKNPVYIYIYIPRSFAPPRS